MDDRVINQDYIEMKQFENDKITKTLRFVPNFKVRQFSVDGCTASACNVNEEHDCVHFGQIIHDLVTRQQV